MFNCQACLRRHLRTLLASHYSTAAAPKHGSEAPPGARPGRWVPPSRTRRSFPAQSHDTKPEKGERESIADTWANSKEAQEQRSRINDARYPKPEDEQNEQRRLETTLKMELKYLKDPLLLANRVEKLLHNKNEAKAHALCRVSSRAVANVVSWNHLINYQLQKGSTQIALHTYNEMKKRGIRPDSHTYLLVLRGLAEFAHHPNSLSRALSVYHSMSGPNTRVRPSVTHTNAMLKVCARANDTDSLMDIVSRMPERGPDSADSWTFTTILNHLRHGAQIAPPGEETKADERRRIEAAVIQGRKLWKVTIDKWRAGDLAMDEGLVCAMGRLLLISPRPRDWDDVLSLTHQTMDVARPMPRLGVSGRELPPMPKNHVLAKPDPDRESLSLMEEDEEEKSVYLDPPIGSAYDVVNANDPKQHNSMNAPTLRTKDGKTRFSRSSFAPAGNNVFSLVLEACLKQMAKQPALDYYSYFTSQQPKPFPPDRNNLEMLLRVMRQSHSSAAALALIREEFPKHSIKPTEKAFRLAMSSCLHDNRNPNAFSLASQILDASLNTLGEPDIKVLQIFLSVAQITARNAAYPNIPQARISARDETSHAWGAELDAPDQPPVNPTSPNNPNSKAKDTAARVTEARILIRALERLEAGLLHLKVLVNIGRDVEPGQQTAPYEVKRMSNERKDAESFDFVRRIISVYDRLLHRGLDPQDKDRRETDLLTPQWRRTFLERRRKLAAWLARAKGRGDRRESVDRSKLPQPRRATRGQLSEAGFEQADERGDSDGGGKGGVSGAELAQEVAANIRGPLRAGVQG
ncbi:MAG: hypothetical protein M1828_003322 [Chrysothrix sp. TS-e1954]|nr:MAG: hypothetical protein M1828_003322 [Chrysothrix sp. TS-e1954]